MCFCNILYAFFISLMLVVGRTGYKP